MNELLECKTLTEAAKIVLGINYYNGNVRKKLIKKCSEVYNIDIVNIINQNKNKKTENGICLNCGKTLKNGQKKFCSSSCSATYNNEKRGKFSDETKAKISKGLQEYYSQNLKNKEGRILVNNHYLYEKICPTCGNRFITKRKQIRFCSSFCAQNNEEVKEKIRVKQKELIKNGKFKGWQSRNIVSYPEKFFIEVLNNNGIEFIKEDFTTKKYFLDFLIILENDVKLDLEIDGKQHEYEDRKAKDEVRDKYLTENGYVVYRIKWNEINTEKGRLKMKEKIEAFFEFYNKLKSKTNAL